MTFQELDKLAIKWNEIANRHRSKQERIVTQIAQCYEEMVSEALHTIAAIETIKAMGEEPQKHILVKLLDDYSDSRFVFAEYRNLKTACDLIIFLMPEIVNFTNKYLSISSMHQAYKRVIESNFTKFVPVEEMDLDAAIFEAGLISGRYNCDCVPEKVNGYWVFRDENGKIRKPSTFKPVYLEDLV